ncbi:MAG: class I SAM-dependent DNA methyltransferase, partial [Aeriscardovia sp.]|nr:class I SAM-dependent DNA methyltransferase [Aeriscardovia sp.]
LFKSDVEFPQFPEGTRKELLDLVSDFKYWDRINISVFGPIMDSVFAGKYRRENGIYYTSKENIQKVINPLFMDDLRHELEEIKRTKDFEKQRSDLDAFHGKLSRLQFFDPACGSGNFLTETYMELRDLEDEVIALESSTSHNLNNEIKVSLSQFHGIELNPYAVTVARTALQIAREEALERSYARFADLQSVTLSFLPLKDELKGIVCGNALELNWGDLVTPSKDLFIFGNPPYSGDYNKSDQQRRDIERVFEGTLVPTGKLDYCAAWYYKAAKFLNHSGGSLAFLSTNSLTQGVQVPLLFKPITSMGWKISFAYPSFKWDNKGAVVTVCIIGMTQNSDIQPELWDGEKFEKVDCISPYDLQPLPTVFIEKRTKPISPSLPSMIYGSKISDGGGVNSQGRKREGRGGKG